MMDKVIDMAVCGIKDATNSVIDTAKAFSPSIIPGVGYFIEAGDKIPSLPQDEKLILAGAFGAATILAVDAGQSVGQTLYQVAHYATQPDEETSRIGCFATNFAGGMAGAVLATTFTFSAIDERPQDMAELMNNIGQKFELVMPEQNQ